MTTRSAPICMWCRNLEPVGMFCKAFPSEEGKQISETILNGENDHRQPVSGDHGVQFEYDPEKGDLPERYN